MLSPDVSLFFAFLRSFHAEPLFGCNSLVFPVCTGGFISQHHHTYFKGPAGNFLLLLLFNGSWQQLVGALTL